MSHRIWNFNPGPATLPLPVLEKTQQELLDYNQTGMSIMELSHRANDYKTIQTDTKLLIKELLNIPDHYQILFLQGGASLQFVMVPMNLLNKNESADYVLTGVWSQKAIQEAAHFGNTRIAGSSERLRFISIPTLKELELDKSAKYVHITSNNTIYGTQWSSFPETGNIPLVADMSSDIFSRNIDVKSFGLIYAGAQKNMGIAGITVVIVRDDLLEQCRKDIPVFMRYTTHAEKDSLYNTPATFSVYITKLVLEWIKNQGGLKAIEKSNSEKAELLYQFIDTHSEFYRGTVAKNSRSMMNVTLKLPSEELESRFVKQSIAAGFSGLKGHRSVGGIRVSLYNAMPLAGVKALIDFMSDFLSKV